MEEEDSSKLDVAEERLGNGTVALRLSGDLDLGTAGDLRERLNELSAEAGTIRIDLSSLGFMDSTGVSLLIASTQSAQDGGPNLELVRPTGEAWRVIELTGIEDVLPFVD